VNIRVTFNPDKVKAYRLIGYGTRTPKVGGFGRSRVGTAEIRAGQRITSLYEIIPFGPTAGETVRKESAVVLVSYREPSAIMPQQVTRLVYDLTETGAAATDNFKFSAAVAQFGMILKNSELKDEAALNKLLQLAKDAVGEDKYGYRKQFIQMVEAYKKMQKEKESTRNP
jgi:Ca-activated chloride channel family protein